jgi:serine protease Do
MPKPVRIVWLAALAGPLVFSPAPSRAQVPAADSHPAAKAENLYRVLIDKQDPFGTDAKRPPGNDNVFMVTALLDPADEALGATIEPVGDELRAQLGLPEGQGLLVASLAGEGPAAQAGLQPNDVLVELADKPLGKKDDLTQQLKSAGEGPVPLKLIRAGKPVTLRIRPVYRVTLGPAGEEKTEYYIGVAVSAPSDALRAHLGIERGLVATEVVKDSPAEKAGVKVHDVLVEIDGKPLDRTETLVQQVQAARDKAMELKLLRAGKERTLQVTPAPRKVQAQPARHREALRLWSLGQQAHPQWYRNQPGQPLLDPQGRLGAARSLLNQVGADPVGKRLDDLDRELKALRKAVDDLRDALKSSPARGRD